MMQEQTRMTMMQSLLRAGVQLAEALKAENTALAALDLPRAAELAPLKVQASDAFAAAYQAAGKLGVKAEAKERATVESLAGGLAALTAENRRLLERAIALQARVIETIAGAAVPAASGPARYGQAGMRTAPRLTPAVAYSARA